MQSTLLVLPSRTEKNFCGITEYFDEILVKIFVENDWKHVFYFGRLMP